MGLLIISMQDVSGSGATLEDARQARGCGWRGRCGIGGYNWRIGCGATTAVGAGTSGAVVGGAVVNC